MINLYIIRDCRKDVIFVESQVRITDEFCQLEIKHLAANLTYVAEKKTFIV